MPDDDEITIDELVNLSGVPRRNIRYLISEGVVPEPSGQKRWARYGPDHIHALQVYSALKKNGVSSLDIIKDKIECADENTPTLVIDHIDGVKIQIDQGVIDKMGSENLINQITKEIKRKIAKKG
jgi:DNA-binding transcriptional MerR regulator